MSCDVTWRNLLQSHVQKRIQKNDCLHNDHLRTAGVRLGTDWAPTGHRLHRSANQGFPATCTISF
jgi:hypothetical protein